MKEKVESPCIECKYMVECQRMCYDRLEWSIIDAEKDDEELEIYGNNLKVKGSQRIKRNKKTKYEDKDEAVQELLNDFDKIYRREVIGYILSRK